MKRELTSRVLTCLGLAILGIIALSVLFVAQWMVFRTDYRIQLPNGYELVRLHGSTIVLDKPGPDCACIAATVDGYHVQGHIVIGHVSDDPSYRHVMPSVPGYFLVDTKKGTVFQGLSEAQWLKILKEYGIAQKPQLRRPSRWDRYRKW